MGKKEKKKEKPDKPVEESDNGVKAIKNWTCTACEYPHEGEDAVSEECLSCGEARPVPTASAEEGGDGDTDRFESICCGCVLSVEDLANKLKQCSVDVGLGETVSVVTNASNVAEGNLVVVARVGARIDGEEVKKRSVGGRASEGMLCDAPSLGWTGGGAGAAANVPNSFAPGDRPPARRPRMDGK